MAREHGMCSAMRKRERSPAEHDRATRRLTRGNGDEPLGPEKTLDLVAASPRILHQDPPAMIQRAPSRRQQGSGLGE